MSDIGFRLVTDSSDFLSGFNQASRAIGDLKSETDSFNKDAKAAFAGPTAAVESFNSEVKDSTKSTGKMIEETGKMSKNANIIKQLKQQIKDYTTAAFLAGEGTAAFTHNLERAGALRDQLADLNAQVNALNGNLGENFARAAGNSISLVAKGFEGVTALQVLAGNNNKAFEETLLKLQSLNAIASLAQEFAGLGDTLTEIRLGFSQTAGLITSGAGNIVSIYQGTNETLKTFFTNFGANARSVFTGAIGFVKNFGSNAASVARGLGSGFASFFSNFGANMKSFATAARNGINAIGTAIKANPLGVILTVITLVIGAMIALKDKVKPIAALFQFLGEIMDDIVAAFDKFLELIGAAKTESEKKTQAIIDGTQKELDALKGRYDFEIQAIEAAGLSTTAKEKEKEKAVLDRIAKSIVALKLKKIAEGKLGAEELKKLQELEEERLSVIRAGITAGIKAQTEAKKREADLEKNIAEARKRELDKRRQLEDKFRADLADLAKRAQAAELAGLSGKEKIEKEKQIADIELQNLRANLEKKGRELDKNFKFTNEQENQFGKIQSEINRKYNNDILQDDIRVATERGAQKLKEVQDSKSALDSKVKTFQLEQDLKQAEIEALTNPPGVTQEDFEDQQQKAILQIKKQAAQNAVSIKQAEVDAETKLTIQQAENEIAVLKAKGDTASLAEAKRLEGTFDGIKNGGEIQKKLIKAQADAISNEVDKNIKQLDRKMAERSHVIDWAKLLGLGSEADIQKIKSALQNVVTETAAAITSIIALQQNALDQQLAGTQKKIEDSNRLIDQKKSEIDELEGSLGKERDLQEQGLANNTDAINAQIALKQKQLAEEEAQRQAQLDQEKKIKEEKLKLAKEQAAVDTISQGVNLITASTNLYKSLSPLGPIGIGIATATIAAMIAGFVASRALVFQQLNNQQFAEGGYTGDGGKYDSAGTVHKGEYVMNKAITKENWDLLHGLHTGDDRLIEMGLRDLVKGRGIMLTSDIPAELNRYKTSIREAELRAIYHNDNSGVESRLSNLESYLATIAGQGKESVTYLPDGTKIIKRGSHTQIIKKNG